MENEPSASRQALRSAIREMEVALVCSLARRLRATSSEVTIAAWVSEFGVQGAVQRVASAPRSMLARIINVFGAR